MPGPPMFSFGQIGPRQTFLAPSPNLAGAFFKVVRDVLERVLRQALVSHRRFRFDAECPVCFFSFLTDIALQLLLCSLRVADSRRRGAMFEELRKLLLLFSGFFEGVSLAF